MPNHAKKVWHGVRYDSPMPNGKRRNNQQQLEGFTMGIQFKRECFTGETIYINFEDMFPGGFEFVAECYRQDPEQTDITRGHYVGTWVCKAYENARLLMLAGF
jgi:hypothetical protein